MFAPETSTSNRAAIGGMIANNSSGMTSIRHGLTRAHVLEIRAMLADGTEVTLASPDAEPSGGRESKLRRDPRSHLIESTTARAVFYSALTTTVSFGSLGFCSHLGMRSLGIELTAGMILTVISVLVVLPALIGLCPGKKSRSRA